MSLTDNIGLDLDFDLGLDFDLNSELNEDLTSDFELDSVDPENKPKLKSYEDPENDLKDEIRRFRKKNYEFQATNDKETYLTIVFSTKEDKLEFLRNVGIKAHTIVNGYELTEKLNINPERPSVKLAPPLKPRGR